MLESTTWNWIKNDLWKNLNDKWALLSSERPFFILPNENNKMDNLGLTTEQNIVYPAIKKPVTVTIVEIRDSLKEVIFSNNSLDGIP